MSSILANTPLATDEETEARLEKGSESGVRDSRCRAWRPLTAPPWVKCPLQCPQGLGPKAVPKSKFLGPTSVLSAYLLRPREDSHWPLVTQQGVLRPQACTLSPPLSPALVPCSQDGLKRQFWTSGLLRSWEGLRLGCLCLLPNLSSAFRASSWAAPSRKSAMTSSLLDHNSSKLSCPERGIDPARITQQEHRQELNILDHTAPASHTPAPTSQTCFQRRTAPDNTLNKAGVIPETDLKQESKREQVLMPKKESSGFSR